MMLKTQSSYDLQSKLRVYSRLHANLLTFLVVLIFSLYYFADACVRASEKYFWYDEIFTVYICRLPTFHASWNAVLHGADFNPPLVYALTRLANAVVGEGLIGSRLPEMIGFWICLLCLFRFVRRQCGLMGGFVAMAFPLFTTAYFYSYEARPHAIVLAFCGLALVFWQTIQERPGERWWLVPFALSLMGASLSHCYGIALGFPFAVTELVWTFRSHRVRWEMWAAMIISLLGAIVVIYPLLQSYNRIVQGTAFAQAVVPTWYEVTVFYDSVLPPSLLKIVVLCVFLLSTCVLDRRHANSSDQALNWTSIALPLGFLALPAFGVLLGKVIDGPFLPRYFLSAVIGLSVLIGFAAARCRPRWLAVALVCVIVLSLSKNFATLLIHHSPEWGKLAVTLSGGRIKVNMQPRHPLADHALLKSADSARSLPIVVPEGLDFVYLANYDRAQESRLYYVSDYAHDTYLREYELLRTLCGLTFNPGRTVDDFTKSNREFFVYGNVSEASLWLSDYEKRGGVVKSIKFSGNQFLADVQMEPNS